MLKVGVAPGTHPEFPSISGGPSPVGRGGECVLERQGPGRQLCSQAEVAGAAGEVQARPSGLQRQGQGPPGQRGGVKEAAGLSPAPREQTRH